MRVSGLQNSYSEANAGKGRRYSLIGGRGPARGSLSTKNRVEATRSRRPGIGREKSIETEKLMF